MPSLYKFGQSLRELIASNLAQFEPIAQPRRGKRRAAIAFTLVDYSEPANLDNIGYSPSRRDEAAFILTRRGSDLSSHAGQRAFPGGRLDPGETPQQAALRELEEEVGLKLEIADILGRLDDYPTRSGYVITPFVVWGGTGRVLRPNPGEVRTVHRIPCRELLRDDAPMLDTIPESEHPVLRMPLGDAWFAAPSAAIAYQFREVALLGRNTRVAHFEQPYFAWK